MSERRPVPLDYRPPIADVPPPERPPGWSRNAILTGATLAAVGMPIMLTGMTGGRSLGVLELAVLALSLFSIGFWPAITLLSLRDRWRPSSVLTAADGAYVLLMLGVSLMTITWFGANAISPGIGLLNILLLASTGVWTTDFTLARKPPAWIGVPLLLVGLVSGVPLAICPHATRLLVLGNSITLSGQACGNTPKWMPWWLALSTN